MNKIIAYAYEADVHCPSCAEQASHRMKLDHNHPYAMGEPCKDDNGIEYDLIDAEGNIITPLFKTDTALSFRRSRYRALRRLHLVFDDRDIEHCGDCGCDLI